MSVSREPPCPSPLPMTTPPTLAEDARARADWALLKVSLLQEQFVEEKAGCVSRQLTGYATP